MRPDKNSYFMALAYAAASRATCPRKSVGAVLVRPNGTVISTGYNGAARGMPHCDPEGCLLEHGHCATAIHAEVNAIAQAARNGVATDGASIYATCFPCWACLKLLANAGIKKIFYAEILDQYHIEQRVLDLCHGSGIARQAVAP